MRRYELVGRLVFKAKDLTDAFRKLAAHFTALASGKTSNLPDIDTDIKVRVEYAEPLISTIPPPPRLPKIDKPDGD